MINTKQKEAAKAFADRWAGKGYEKGESQTFWIELLQQVLGVERPFDIISFENQVKLANTSFIDAYIEPTKVLIEQKSIDKDLRAPIKQSDGSMLNPFQQAKRYVSELPVSRHPKYIVTCNFKSFLIYDMNNPQGEPFEILLENLEKEYHLLNFLVDDGKAELKHEIEVSVKAGNIVGEIYDALLAQYGDNISKEDMHALNVLCVRLVFCLYAEDAGIFAKDQFYNYLKAFQSNQIRNALKELFAVLDTPVESRDRFLEDTLKAFPYVNGSLFKQTEADQVPPFTKETTDLLLRQASIDFDWSEISPTIFGAVFESTLNPDTRRSGGMHYTSIENIHKVIDPLFLNDLKDEFIGIKNSPAGKKRTAQLQEFQNKLASLKFLDPACGSGNFLTETYLSLRRLENQVILEQTKGQGLLGFEEVNPIKVSIHQFYGIEINDFAVTVATTALWIAEAQMMTETEKIIQMDLDYLPLKSNTNIARANALRIDWASVINGESVNCGIGESDSNHVISSDSEKSLSNSQLYIMGNPPFVGARLMSAEQKEDVISIFGAKWKNVGNLDYVCCWYKKAVELMSENNNIKTALVSTNSVSQGEQVANLWKPLMQDMGVHIDFAYRTFRWDSEASLKAHVHCVIIGFSVAKSNKDKILYGESNIPKVASNINPYLIDAPMTFIESNKKPICEVPDMVFGNMANDGGGFILTCEEKDLILKQNPNLEKYIKLFLGSEEFINKKERYCLWLLHANPSEIKSNQFILERIECVRAMRAESKRDGTRKLADTPTLFGEIRQPEQGFYLLVPRVSSEKRKYVPMGFLDGNTIASDSVQIIPNASLYHFGVLTSNVHMAWMRAVCGRLEMRYRYSKDIVYNNFPWPHSVQSENKDLSTTLRSGRDDVKEIERTAQSILDARALYPDCSLADLYDEVTMPPELRRAHQDNDRAVMQAYGFPIKDFTESDCVARLFELYSKLTEK